MGKQLQEEFIALAAPALQLATTRLRDEMVRAGLHCAEVQGVSHGVVCGAGFLVGLGASLGDEISTVTVVLTKGGVAAGLDAGVPGIILVQVGGPKDKVLCNWLSEPVPPEAPAAEFLERIEALDIDSIAATAIKSIAAQLDEHSPFDRPGYAQ